MRTTTLILLITLLLLASCKRQTCQCTVDAKTTSGTFRKSIGEETYMFAKKRAENRCKVLEDGHRDKDTSARCRIL